MEIKYIVLLSDLGREHLQHWKGLIKNESVLYCSSFIPMPYFLNVKAQCSRDYLNLHLPYSFVVYALEANKEILGFYNTHNSQNKEKHREQNPHKESMEENHS